MGIIYTLYITWLFDLVNFNTYNNGLIEKWNIEPNVFPNEVKINSAMRSLQY